MKYNEKRTFMRINVDCEMQYRTVDSADFKVATCTSLSGAGLSFIGHEFIAEGKVLEIDITPKSSITPSFSAFVEVIRINLRDDNAYEVATTIKTIKG